MNVHVSSRSTLLIAALFVCLTGFGETYPDVPSILRDLSMIEVDASGNYGYTRPHIPPHRTSADGRVALGIKYLDNTLRFSLFVPERLSNRFSLTAKNTTIVQGIYTVLNSRFFIKDDGDPLTRTGVNETFAPAGGISHRAICDVASEFPTETMVQNPSQCTNDTSHDCYDFKVIVTYTGKDIATNSKPQSQLWATPVTVEVANPKTVNAQIVNITTGTPVGGSIFGFSAIFEPMITTDGRLLVARIDNSDLTWPKNETTSVTGKYDVVYSVAPQTATACDVREWNQFYPITHAPHHPEVSARYAFAFSKFRDPENVEIGDGVELGGTYPWIDRKGKNLFFSTFGYTLHKFNGGAVSTVYPTDCVPGVACNLSPTAMADVEINDGSRGLSVMGAWTAGKMVMLDGILNNIDFGLRSTPADHRMVRLYEPVISTEITDKSWVRLGTGRDINIFTTPNNFLSTSFNTTMTESVENLFQHNPNMRPVTPRDVVWIVNDGRASQEVVFDDFLDPNVLIYSEMTGSLSWNNGKLVYNNSTQLRVQNAATSPNLRLPPFGNVRGTARIAPVALGGVGGRGLWLNGSDAYVEYPITTNPSTTPNLFVSFFIDPRPNNTNVKRLVTFPDNSSIVQNGNSINYMTAGNVNVHTVSLPWNLTTKAWESLAMSYSVAPSSTQPGTWVQTIRFHVRGMPVDKWDNTSAKLFDLRPGTLLFGGAPGGTNNFRGWIDEIKVLTYVPNREMICNHARGTLITAPPTFTGGLSSLALKYPSWTQTEMQQILGDSVKNFYACGVSWTANDLGYAAGFQTGVSLLRERFTMTSHLIFNQPRPGFSQNAFCKSCHVEQANRLPTLRPAALTPPESATTYMQYDTRRQPMQPPRLIFGNIPAGLYPGPRPSAAQVAPAEGALQDEWVFPQ